MTPRICFMVAGTQFLVCLIAILTHEVFTAQATFATGFSWFMAGLIVRFDGKKEKK